MKSANARSGDATGSPARCVRWEPRRPPDRQEVARHPPDFVWHQHMHLTSSRKSRHAVDVESVDVGQGRAFTRAQQRSPASLWCRDQAGNGQIHARQKHRPLMPKQRTKLILGELTKGLTPRDQSVLSADELSSEDWHDEKVVVQRGRGQPS